MTVYVLLELGHETQDDTIRGVFSSVEGASEAVTVDTPWRTDDNVEWYAQYTKEYAHYTITRVTVDSKVLVS